MIKKIIYTCLFIFVTLSSQVKAVETDSIRISLLTCSPGEEIYSLFGHTAIRYENISQDIDIVFNYGIFSFNTPNFIWRFVKGETDYQLGVNDYGLFEFEYAARGSSVFQQTLNLTSEEKQRLWMILIDNYKPENRVYRYNFFFDNCTTRARDKIEESLEGIIDYDENEEQLSFRDIIHQYTSGYEWEQFGIDLCLGSKADETADYRHKMFSPFYLLNAVEHAQIKNDFGFIKPLVLKSEEIITRVSSAEKSEANWPTPMQTSIILLLITLLVSLFGIYKRKLYWGIDILIFGGIGICGCVIAFLVFFSVHPAVSPNYLLVFLNPIHLFYLPFMIYRGIRRKKDWFQWLNLSVLILFILFWWALPQKFNLAILPLASCLLIRSARYLYLIYKQKE